MDNINAEYELMKVMSVHGCNILCFDDTGFYLQRPDGSFCHDDELTGTEWDIINEYPTDILILAEDKKFPFKINQDSLEYFTVTKKNTEYGTKYCFRMKENVEFL